MIVHIRKWFSRPQQPVSGNHPNDSYRSLADEALYEQQSDEESSSSKEQAKLLLGFFHDSREHLHQELRRIGFLTRAQIYHYRGSVAPKSPGEKWSLHYSDIEIDEFLHKDFQMPDEVAEWARNAVEIETQKAETLRANIDQWRKLQGKQDELRLIQLAERFHLSPEEIDVLLICLLPEVYSRYYHYYGYLQRDPNRTLPSIQLIQQILQETDLANNTAFEADRSLVKQRLATLGADPNLISPTSSVQIETRIANYLFNGNAIDSRLNNIVSLAPALSEEPLFDPLTGDRLENFRVWWKSRQDIRQEQAQDFYRQWRFDPKLSVPEIIGATVMLHAPYGAGKQEFAQVVSEWSKVPLLIAQVDAALHSPLGWEAIVDLVYREGRLSDAIVYWEGCETLLDTSDPNAPNKAAQAMLQWNYLTAAAEAYPHLTFLASQSLWEPVGRYLGQHTFTRIDLPAPNYEMRVQLWRKQLEALRSRAAVEWGEHEALALAQSLANSFQFTGGQIVDASHAAYSLALERDPGNLVIKEDDLFVGSRRQTGKRLKSLARQIGSRTQVKFADLLLPAATRTQLEELKTRVKSLYPTLSELNLEKKISRGKGVIALFTGTSGTGKTTAAEALAGELGVDLYKVDLSAVVSKYVGETEKQLNQVFTEAEASNAMLFFDEGDALFGKRGEVKDAQDRWANQEVNFLLQRIEEYTGVVIIATNFGQNIDEAFRRRIHVVIEFPFPDKALRREIWQHTLSKFSFDQPDNLQLDWLSSFRFTGGNIQNIVFDAAQRRRERPHEDPMKLLVLALTREYQKLGRPITRTEFGAMYFQWLLDEHFL